MHLVFGDPVIRLGEEVDEFLMTVFVEDVALAGAFEEGGVDSHIVVIGVRVFNYMAA